MGWVKERPGRDGKVRFTAMYRDLEGHERSAGTWSTQKRAIAEWHKAEEKLSSSRPTDPTKAKKTVRQYVAEDWLRNHVIEESTRETYVYTLNKYILPELGDIRLKQLTSPRLRQWITALQSEYDAGPPTIQKAKIVLDAILSTALHDGAVEYHAGRGVKTPPVATKPRRIITPETFGEIHNAIQEPAMQLLVELDIETGLRWGELTELRPQDLDFTTHVVTVGRAVVELKAKDRPSGQRFVIKQYPKDQDWRQLKIAEHLSKKIQAHIARHGFAREDLLFTQPQPQGARRRRTPAELPDPATLGLTQPNAAGRQYRHGTLTAYTTGKCRCRNCKGAVAAYRAARRASGHDDPRQLRTVDTDGHVSAGWFRTQVWTKALKAAGVEFRVTPHGLRHAHASWLLKGGADLQVVKERLGHGSISTTEKYLHALPGADDSALRALDAMRGRPGTDLPVPADSDSQQTELEEMRDMVRKLSSLLGLGNTA